MGVRMAIKSMVELIQQAETTLADNVTQDISAADVRLMIENVVDSLAPAYGSMELETKVQAIDATPTALTGWTFVVAEADTAYLCNLLAGTVTRKVTSAGIAGATDNTLVSGAVAGNVNDVVDITLYRNGAATSFGTTITCQGVGRPMSFQMNAWNYSTVDAVYDVRVSGSTGTATFSNVIIIARAIPVRSYI